ncbi:peptidoglycan editing factor PgeF [Luteimonas sp. e5]
MPNHAQPWIAADWPAPPGVQAVTTLRHGAGVSAPPFEDFNLGNRCGDAPAAVAANRRQLCALLALPAPPRWLRQVHGIGVQRFADAPADMAGDADEPEADAAVTSARGVVLAVLTADCLPVVLAAADGSEVAVAHAGWRGLAAGVLEATAGAMRTPPAQLMAWLGPAAGPEAYEIGVEVRDAFLAVDSAADAAFQPTRPGHWRIDLYALARQRLSAAGLPAHAIHGGTRCTIGEPQAFFSHRRSTQQGSGRTGRIATLAWRAV